jgi:glucosylceramidase
LLPLPTGANDSLVNAGSGKCLDVTGGGAANEPQAQLSGPARAARTQRWTVPV